MFPKIIIKTKTNIYSEEDIISDVNKKYSYYFKLINKSLDNIVSYDFKLKKNFKFKEIDIWYSNNLYERNIQKGDLINNLIAMEYIRSISKKKTFIINIKTDSKQLCKALNELNIKCNLLYDKFNFFNYIRRFYLARGIVFFFKTLYKSITIKKNNFFTNFLDGSKNILFTPYDYKNIYLKNLEKFCSKIDTITKSKIIHIQYMTNLSHKFNINSLEKSKFRNKKCINLFEIIKFTEVFYLVYIYLNFYLSSSKYLNEIYNYFEQRKQLYFYYIIKSELKESFMGPMLFQNIFNIYVFKKIEKNLSKKINLFYNFENQYWEKIFLQVFNKYSNKTFGIIDNPPKLWDSVLYINNYNSNKKIIPDFILYSSPIYPKLISPKNKNIKNKLILIESFRYKKFHNLSNKKSSNILVFGDGNKYSNTLLMDKINKLQKQNNLLSFKFRDHPSNNIRSSSNLNKDILNSKFFIVPNTSNSYLDIFLNNKFPLIFKSNKLINKSIFKLINLDNLFFENIDDFYNHINNFDTTSSKVNIQKTIKNIILINNSFVLFKKFIRLHLKNV